MGPGEAGALLAREAECAAESCSTVVKLLTQLAFFPRLHKQDRLYVKLSPGQFSLVLAKDPLRSPSTLG